MTNATRTDVHRPANLVPENYILEGFLDLEAPIVVGFDENGEPIIDAHRQALTTLLAGPDRAQVGHGYSGFQCDHCGAHLRYVAVLRHLSTFQVIQVGETCLDNRFSQSSEGFHALRKVAQREREQQRLLVAAWECLAELGAPAYWLLVPERCTLKGEEWSPGWCDERPWSVAPVSYDHDLLAEVREHYIVGDIRAKLRRYGSVSENQVALVERIYHQEEQRRAEKAEEAAIPTMAAPAGRQAVEGTILAVKVYDTQWGSSWKCLVAVDGAEGRWKAWGALPSRLVGEAAKGRRITFTAAFEPAADDPSFARYSRPTKASLID